MYACKQVTSSKELLYFCCVKNVMSQVSFHMNIPNIFLFTNEIPNMFVISKAIISQIIFYTFQFLSS